MPSSHGHGIFSSSLFRSSKPREITDNPASQVASDPDPPAPLPQSHSPSVTRTAPSQSYYHHSVRRSISSQISFVSPLKRSISLRSGLRSDYSNPPASPSRPNNVLTLPAFVVDRQSSADALNHARAPSHSSKGSTSLDPSRQPASANMTSVQYRNPPSARPPPTAQPNMSLYTQSNGSLGAPAPISSTSAPGSQNPQAVYQHILDTSSKRISTLDYLRKSHEGRVYWFNTLLFTKPDLLKLPYFSPQKLARRATNYLLLGFSLPMILDLNSQTPNEYLKALNALLGEFEQFQNMHPPDGSSSSSLSRARIPQMFKRATGAGTKSRRMTDAGMPSLTPTESTGSNSSMNNPLSSGGPSSSHQAMGAVATTAEPLLPTEQYAHLLTPPLPFDPDYFETFATLCDVLIDCYSRVTHLVSSPEACAPGTGVAELFAKADARVRKIIIAGVVREFEERCREGVKGEMAGVGKVVLGGLM